MSTLAKSVEFDDSMMWVDFTDGRRLGVPLAFFPRLLHATPEQRGNLTISGGGLGLHWDALDEDIHVGNLLTGIGDRSKSSELAA
jgi:hypothetical protein